MKPDIKNNIIVQRSYRLYYIGFISTIVISIKLHKLRYIKLHGFILSVCFYLCMCRPMYNFYAVILVINIVIIVVFQLLDVFLIW